MPPNETPSERRRRLRERFIVENLQFSPGLSVKQDDVISAYQHSIGERHYDFYAPDIGALYNSIVRMGATRDEKEKTFYGVGLRT